MSGMNPGARQPPASPGVGPAGDWQRVEALFAEALELNRQQRAAWLDGQCGTDTALRDRVGELLAAHDELEGRFLTGLPPEHAEALLHEVGEAEGSTIAEYQVRRRIGRGGMGVVYLAHDPRLDRPVALKLLPAYLSGDAVANRRLLAEARAASGLDHPNIATVYEVGRADDDRLFIAMAYCEGATLRERLDAGPLSTGEALDIAAQVADGLAAAHDRGIVHRDIKPENIVCGPDGRVRILDFGIARAAEAVLTRVAGTRGTVAYMSPEQTSTDDVDARSDLWSLGVVLFEMLAGRRPFAADGGDATIHAIRHDPVPPLRSFREDVPDVVLQLLDGCLEKEPQKRVASAADLAGRLRYARQIAAGDVAIHGPPVFLPAATLLRRSALYLAACLLALLGVLQLSSRLLLPEWTVVGVAMVLAAGLPALFSTGVMRLRPAGSRRWAPALVILAMAVLAGGSGMVAASGSPRITDSRGGATPLEGGRGWVVLADVDHPEIGAAVREALSVDLHQSGTVSVLGGAQLAGTLRRMGLADTVRLSERVAREVAERAGAGAVLLVDVSRLGPQYVLAGRAIRPATGEELFAVRTAAGEDRLLQGVETLSRAMRRRLGEARDDVRRSRPLPEVTTSSLEALRLYAEAERLALIDPGAAAAAIGAALEADPGFAMAHRLAGVLAYNQLRFGDADRHFTRAWELRDHLSDRERWLAEAFYRGKVELEPRRAAEALDLVLQRYPDDFTAASNLVNVLHSWLADPEGGHAMAMRTLEIDPWSPMALSNGLMSSFMSGRVKLADSIADLAAERGQPMMVLRYRMARAFATGDYRGTAMLCDSLLAGMPRQPALADDYEFCGSADVAAGRLRQGVDRLQVAERSYREAARHRNVAHAAQGIATARIFLGDEAGAIAAIRSVVDGFPVDRIEDPDRFINRTNLQVQAALLGRADLVEEIGRTYPPYGRENHWFGRLGDSLVEAALAVSRGDGDAALAALSAGHPGERDAIGWRIWTHLVRGMAWELNGRPDSAVVSYRRATDRSLHISRSMTKNRLYFPTALQRLAGAAREAGDFDTAAAAQHGLLELWRDADPVMRPHVAAAEEALARLEPGGR